MNQSTSSIRSNILTQIWDYLVSANETITDPSEKRYARLASSFLLVINILNLIGFVAGGIVIGFSGSIRQQAFTLLASLLSYLLSRTRYYTASIFIFSLTFGLSAYTSAIIGGPETNFLSLIFSYVPLSLIVGSIYLPWQMMAILIAVDIIGINVVPLFGVPLQDNAAGISGILFTIGVILVFFSNFRKTTEKLRLEEVQQVNKELEASSANLEKRVQERTAELIKNTEQMQKRSLQLEAIANVARSATTSKNVEALLPTIAKDISDHFNFYHVGIFLLDNNKEYAILSASNSEGGQRMLARGHRLKVGEQGIVGFATFSGNPRIALDIGEDAVFFNNPDLPETHSEIALPLKFGNEIIGALDIQSTEVNAFTQDDVDTLSILADQVSVAIQNARSLEQAQRAVNEAELATSQLTGRSWKSYSETLKIKGYRYDGIKPEPIKQFSKSKKDGDVLAIPIRLRGQAIGQLKLKTIDPSRKLSADEMAVIESTADRVALALEGARLLNDAQKRATRETIISELAVKLGASFQLDSILRDTVEELGQTLKDTTVTFQLVNPSAPPQPEKEEDRTARRTRSE